MTSNLPVYEELVPDPDIELILLGGLVRRNKSLVGFLTEDCMRQGARRAAVDGHERGALRRHGGEHDGGRGPGRRA
jgi:hypothetical protein